MLIDWNINALRTKITDSSIEFVSVLQFFCLASRYSNRKPYKWCNNIIKHFFQHQRYIGLIYATIQYEDSCLTFIASTSYQNKKYTLLHKIKDCLSKKIIEDLCIDKSFCPYIQIPKIITLPFIINRYNHSHTFSFLSLFPTFFNNFFFLRLIPSLPSLPRIKLGSGRRL